MKNKKITKVHKTLFLITILTLIPTSAFALQSVDFAITEICKHMEGSLGSLLMIAAGVGGIISAAMGNIRAMYSCLITAIGAFTISSMLSLYFPDAAKTCSNGTSGGGDSGGRSSREIPGNFKSARVSSFDAESVAKSYIERTSGLQNTEVIESEGTSKNGTNENTDEKLEKNEQTSEEEDHELF
jgi:hypothetical protein